MVDFFRCQVSRVVFSTLPCEDLGAVGKFLKADYHVDCTSAKYKRFRVFAIIGVLVWPLGFPAGCLGMLYYYNVPNIAARKVQRAQVRAFLDHCISRLVTTGTPLHGITSDASLEELGKMQLWHLAELLGLLTSDQALTRDEAPVSLDVSTGDVVGAILQGGTSTDIEMKTPGPARTPAVQPPGEIEMLPADPADTGATPQVGDIAEAELLEMVWQHIKKLVKTEQLVVPALQWDPHSQDADEVLALARWGLLIAAYEPERCLSQSRLAHAKGQMKMHYMQMPYIKHAHDRPRP